jgi:hypothetical protein
MAKKFTVRFHPPGEAKETADAVDTLDEAKQLVLDRYPQAHFRDFDDRRSERSEITWAWASESDFDADWADDDIGRRIVATIIAWDKVD